MNKLIIIALMFLAGCATTPQTRNEFKTWTEKHTTMGLSDTHSVNRPIKDVAAMLQKKWQQCYNLNVTTTRKSGGIATSRYSDNFHPRISRVDDSNIELTLQMTTQGMVMLNKVPEGGEYKIALDIQRLKKDKTQISWHSYAVGGWREAWELNKMWSDGKDAPCQ